MNNREQVIKHLEITQGVVNRLAGNSFLLKGWSMALLAAILIFITKNSVPPYFILLFLIPVTGFWILDGYFLWQERLFRGIYDDIRMQRETDFKMNVPAQLNKPGNKWRDSIFSLTLLIFYGIEIIFIIVVFAMFLFFHCK